MYYTILPTRIKELREKNNWSRTTLANKINVGYHAIRNYELGIRIPDVGIIVSIADAFEVSVDYLLGRDDYLPEKYASFPNINTLDLEMIYQSNKKINKMIDNCREDIK